MSGKYQKIYHFVGCICKSVGMLHHTRQRLQTYWHDASKWHNWQFWCWNKFFKRRNTWPNDLLANKMSFQWVFFWGVVPLPGNVVSRLRSIKVKAGIDPTSVIAGKNKRQQKYQPTNKQTNKHFLHKNCQCLDQSAFPVRCHFLVFNYSFDVSLSFVPVCNMIADLGSIFWLILFQWLPGDNLEGLKPWNRFWYAALFVAANLTFAFHVENLWQTCPATCLRECKAPTLLRT